MQRYWMPAGLIAVLLFLLEPMSAAADAQPVSISGNAWVAMALIGAFIAVIVLVIFGALHLDRRDAQLGRRDSNGFLLPLGGNDDDDIHHHPGHHF